MAKNDYRGRDDYEDEPSFVAAAKMTLPQSKVVLHNMKDRLRQGISDYLILIMLHNDRHKRDRIDVGQALQSLINDQPENDSFPAFVELPHVRNEEM